MISGAEIARSLQGAFRLAARDRSGLDWFDATVTGFWRSFAAAFIALPFYFAFLMAPPPPETGAPPIVVGSTAYIVVQLIAYACGWLAFPLAMTTVTRLIGREHNFLRHIVANNWCTTIPYGIYGVLALLGASGTLPGGLVQFLTLLVVLWTMWLHWFVAREGLEVTGMTAAGVVALDVLISYLVLGVAEGIITGAI